MSVFLFGVALPVMFIIIHSSLRLRNIKNKVTADHFRGHSLTTDQWSINSDHWLQTTNRKTQIFLFGSESFFRQRELDTYYQSWPRGLLILFQRWIIQLLSRLWVKLFNNKYLFTAPDCVPFCLILLWKFANCLLDFFFLEY